MFGLERFVLVLLMLAAGSSGAQWALSGAGIGLSGIGYGLFGLLFALDRWHPRCRGVLDRRVAELFGAWFLLCLVATWYKIMPVANVAHASGFLLGAILGWSLAVDSSKRVLRLGALLAGLALIASGLTAPVRQLVNRSDGYAYELFTRGNEAYDAENWERAAALYEGVVARDAEMFEAWYNLGLAYHQLGREDEASFAVTRSAELEALEDARRASERGSMRDFSILRGDGRVEETD